MISIRLASGETVTTDGLTLDGFHEAMRGDQGLRFVDTAGVERIIGSGQVALAHAWESGAAKQQCDVERQSARDVVLRILKGSDIRPGLLRRDIAYHRQWERDGWAKLPDASTITRALHEAQKATLIARTADGFWHLTPQGEAEAANLASS